MSRAVTFRKSLLGRSLLLGVLPAAAVVFVIVGINSFRAWNNVNARFETDLRAATELAVGEIDLRNQRNIDMARILVASQEAAMFGRRAETLDMLENVLRSNPSICGTYVAYEPDADGADALGAQEGVPANALGAGGRFFAYVKRDAKSPDGIQIEPLVEPVGEDGLWYLLPKERAQRSGVADPVITKPYNYRGVDIIEHVVPIVVKGKFVGVAGVDVALTGLQERLKDISQRLGADVFIETRGYFVAATTDGEKGTSLRTTRVAESLLSPVFRDIVVHGSRPWEAIDPILHEECVYLAATVPTGEWRVLVRKPTRVATEAVTTTIIGNVRTAVIGVVVILVLLSVGAVSISRRVRAAKGIAERIAGGDLSGGSATALESKAATGADESAELVRAMHQMNDELVSIVSAVRGACVRLAATSAQLAATSHEQRATVGAFGESTSQIAAAIREISATGIALQRTIESVDAGARRASESAAKGRTRLDSVASSMSRLDVATSEIAGRLEIIAEKAAAIGTVVVTITKVAEQTNLLSVNAAIEAEKAGDAGLGFLVVAREIRRLADQTAGASLDIERIVGQMQSSVTAGVEEMSRFTGEMRTGTGDVQQIVGDLGGIIAQIDASFASFGEVRSGMTTQAMGVSQIEQAVMQVAAGAQQSSRSAVEFGRVADELAHAVAVLQDAAARFKLREESAATTEEGAA